MPRQWDYRSVPCVVSSGSTDCEVKPSPVPGHIGFVHLHPTFRVGRRELNLEAPNLNCARVVNDIFNAFSTTALSGKPTRVTKTSQAKVVLFLKFSNALDRHIHHGSQRPA